MLILLNIASSQGVTADDIADNSTEINESVAGMPHSADNMAPDAIITENIAATNESDPVYWVDKGNELFNASKYNESIRAYSESIRLDPELASAWNGKGNVLANLGKYDKAIQAYDESIRLDPEDADAWNNKGDALDMLGRHDEAIKSHDRAAELAANISLAS